MSNEEIIYDNEIEIGEVDISFGRKIKVVVSAREGMKYLRFRIYRHHPKDDSWRPTRDGVNIPFVYPLPSEDIKVIESIVELVKQAHIKGQDMPIYDPNGMVVRKKK